MPRTPRPLLFVLPVLDDSRVLPVSVSAVGDPVERPGPFGMILRTRLPVRHPSGYESNEVRITHFGMVPATLEVAAMKIEDVAEAERLRATRDELLRLKEGSINVSFHRESASSAGGHLRGTIGGNLARELWAGDLTDEEKKQIAAEEAAMAKQDKF